MTVSKDMAHIVLLGDSIFDNASYVAEGSSVIEHLRARLPRRWRATLLAVDGAVVSDVRKQMARFPEDGTHVFISAGGNDALENSMIVEDNASTAAEGFAMLAAIQQRFREDYHQMLELVLAKEKPTTLCTIYDAIPGLSAKARAGLSVFNDAILREGFRHGLPILDLRLVCTETGDYSSVSPIEPSGVGGAKIARCICQIVMQHNFQQRHSVVYWD